MYFRTETLLISIVINIFAKQLQIRMRYWEHRLLYIILLLILSHVHLYADTEFTYEQLTTASGLANNTVRTIIQDSKGRLWFATSSGVSRYENGKFTNFHPARNSTSPGLKDQRVKLIMDDKKGHLWFATAKGVSCYDVSTDEFIDHIKKGIAEPTIPDVVIKKIKDKNGRTWEVTDKDGLIVTSSDGKKEHFTTESHSVSLPTNALKCIFMDRDGTIWIGTDNLGVSRLTVMQNTGVEYVLDGENIRMLTRLGKDRIAVGNRSGEVWIFDASLNKMLSHNKYTSNTYCMYEDSHLNIWRGTKGGGLYLNDNKVEGLPHDEIYSIAESNDSCILIGTFGAGLVTYNHKRSTIVDIVLNDTYGSDRIRKMIIDNKGHGLWATTSEGVYSLQTYPSMKVTGHMSTEDETLYSDEVRTAFIDSKGRLFMSEAGYGFAVRDKNGGIKHYTMEDSLVNDMVQSIVEDRQGFIWLSTEFGASCFVPSSGKITNYFFSKDMLKNVYGENCGILLDDGRIAFGSNNGIVIITPSMYTGGIANADIDVNDMTINGKSLTSKVQLIYQQWWRSPWVWAALVLLVALGIFITLKIRNRNKKYDDTINLLNVTNDELAAEKEKLERDVHIRREAVQEATDKEFIQQLENTAHAHISDPDYSADDFARDMGMGRTAFFRKMKDLTGYSPKEYIKLIRIRRAADLISTTSHTIAEIALMVGISDPFYFSRVFKSEYKCSPKEWRQNFVKK